MAPELSRELRSAQEVLEPKAAYLVYGGGETWPVAPSVTAIPLGSLMKRLASKWRGFSVMSSSTPAWLAHLAMSASR